MKSLRGVDYAKYALSAIIYKVQSSENVKVQSPVTLSKQKQNKNIFSIKRLNAHVQQVCNV